jgi:hypothetical protein
MNATQESNATMIRNVFAFIHNIPVNIIDQTWPVEDYGSLNGHLKSKYNSFCEAEGYASANAILRFFSSLSSDNARLFSEKIHQLIQTSNF